MDKLFTNEKKMKYVRDKRSPVPLSDNVSKVMSANRSKDTKPEILFRRSLYESGIRGYRLNWRKVPGRPDIAFPGRKLAIFIHGCYWHRCPHCDLLLPKTNAKFWSEKFQKNKQRDIRKNNDLAMLGWTVMEIWECQIKKGLKEQINDIRKILHK